MELNPEEKHHKRTFFSFNNCLRATKITIMRVFYCHIVIILRSCYDIIKAQHNKYPDLKNCAALPVGCPLCGPFKIESSSNYFCLFKSFIICPITFCFHSKTCRDMIQYEEGALLSLPHMHKHIYFNLLNAVDIRC